jgi:hypothetical protein
VVESAGGEVDSTDAFLFGCESVLDHIRTVSEIQTWIIES